MHYLLRNSKHLATKTKGDQYRAELNDTSRREPAEASRAESIRQARMRPNFVHNLGIWVAGAGIWALRGGVFIQVSRCDPNVRNGH